MKQQQSQFDEGGESGARSPTYRSWDCAIQRCTNPKSPSYAYYGGTGVTVCARWRKFANFLADMGERPEGKTLDRYPNNDGNYEPGNCRWATPREQNFNRRTGGRVIEFNGEHLHLVEWAERIGLSVFSMLDRLRRWPLERALTEPPRAERGRRGATS